MQLNSDNDDLSNINNSPYEFSQIIQNFDKMNIKEIEPTTQKNIHENIFEEDLSIVIDKLLNIYFKQLNEEKERKVRMRNILNNINNFNINLQEIIYWLLNNQNDSNFIYLLGYFTHQGIGVNCDTKKAFKLFQQAANLEHNEAQLELAYMCIDREGVYKNYDKAFELSKNLAKKGFSYGMNLLGYCYINGIGTDINMQKGIELYQKAADLGSCIAQYNLAYKYKDGVGVELNFIKAFELFKKSAEKEYTNGLTMLAYCYNNGIGTYIDKQKAFESYQKAADLENHYAQLKMLAVIDLLMP
jgi:TPR repeat protein